MPLPRGRARPQAKGFDAKGRKTWHGAGCGKSGEITVPWDNVAADKEMKVKGAALLRWNRDTARRGSAPCG
ncbi:hypothetical protein ACFU6R_22340, partial [Streptomyces sp. NPDC057499]|uniref:hypothetical protein n=1 Tax=Streptomyces sp. NPDC057499 TaxID=3346150 RepID=UPI0036A717BC